jgi:hypothetical protein
MAKHALTANRRGFLSSAVAVGAAVAVPIVAAGSAAGATCLGKAAWDAALAHYVRADNAMNRFHNDVLDPAFDRLMAAEHTRICSAPMRRRLLTRWNLQRMTRWKSGSMIW